MAVVPIDDAFSAVERLVREHRGRGRLRLPPQADIAMALGLSCHTTQRVLRAMERAGIVHMSRRTGTRINPDRLTPESLERARQYARARTVHSWERIAERLTDDIRAGVLEPGRQLPSYKSLCLRFSANYRTVRHALASLEKRRVIEGHHRGFRVRQSGTRRSSGTIVFIAKARHPLILMNYTRNSRTFWEAFEQECMRLHVRSEGFGQDTDGNLSRWGDPVSYSVADIMHRYPVLGFVVWAHDMDRAWFSWLMDSLRATGKPISILQESDSLAPADMVSLCGRSSRAAVFPLAIDGNPGDAVARFLYEKGHRSVMFFSFDHPVYAGRAEGIRAMFHSVRARVRERWIDFPTSYSDMLSTRYSPGNRVYVEAENDMRELDAKLGSRFEEYAHTDRTFVDRVLTRDFAYSQWHPYFEQALADTSVTAWIGCNDITALAALRFLRKRSIDVPGDISVIGFDNHYESFTRSLSSFDFNCRAATIAIVRHIVDSPPPRGQRAPIHYTPGFVVERASTRAVRPS